MRYEKSITYVASALPECVINTSATRKQKFYIYSRSVILNKLIMTCPYFEPCGWIPNQNSGYGEDVSPELHIDGLSDSAVSLIITLDDMGHPIQPGYNHWVAWNLPPIAVIPEHLPKGAVCEQPIHLEQGLAYGKHCYRGPKPPFNWNHEYRFTVYVLDTRLNISTDSDKEAVLDSQHFIIQNLVGHI